MKTKTQTWVIIISIMAFVAIIAVLVAGCVTKKPAPVFQAIRKSEGPPTPCDPDPCPPCTNCMTNTIPPLDTNQIWLNVEQYNLLAPDTNFVVPFYIVTKANNLTNGHHYRWERANDLNSGEWIPLNTFLATTNFAFRTNGIPSPDHHFFRIQQLD
jgi:hypothetical protein